MATKKRLIDANKLAEAIEETAEGLADCDQQNAAWALRKYAIRDITDAPTVDAVELMHGHWIDDGGLDEDGNGQYRCSRCGVGEKHNPTVPVSYCWNCGAKMDGDGNG